MSKSTVLLLSLLLASAAHAQVVEINQNTMINGDPTIGDTTPGAPITISVPGKYRFSGNIESTGFNVPAIDVLASSNTRGVTIDLNGFNLRGNSGSACTINAGSMNCPVANAEHGIRGNGYAGTLTIRDGFITGFGGDGVHCPSGCLVEDVVASSNNGRGVFSNLGIARRVVSRNNGDGGIVASTIVDSQAHAIGRIGLSGLKVARSTVQLAYNADGVTAIGISATAGEDLVVLSSSGTGISSNGLISNSQASGVIGMDMTGGNALGNTVSGSSTGIVLNGGSAARENVVNAPTPITGNPISGQNVCNGASC